MKFVQYETDNIIQEQTIAFHIKQITNLHNKVIDFIRRVEETHNLLMLSLCRVVSYGGILKAYTLNSKRKTFSIFHQPKLLQ